MSQRAILSLVFIALSILVLVAGVPLFWHRPTSVDVLATPAVPSEDGLTGQTCALKRVKVIDGHTFDLTLADDRRLLCKLEVVTAPEAFKEVKIFFNSCTEPRAKFIIKEEHIWTVQIVAKKDGQETWLSQYLKDHGLIFQTGISTMVMGMGMSV